MSDEVWESERRLWLEGGDAYVELLHPECIVVFGEPFGIMKGDAITESLRDALRWTEVEMVDRSTTRQGNETIVIAYKAEGHRRGSAPYHAYCSSTYVRRDGALRIIQHQQTPTT